MIEAGSETTSQVINNTLVGLLSNPEVIRRCQEELDRIVGSDRPPTMEDMDDLNYVRSLVKETLRWRPINKLGSNHYLIEDDWYEGYFLPKNSIIMINQWALHYNEDYRDPWKVHLAFSISKDSTIPNGTLTTIFRREIVRLSRMSPNAIISALAVDDASVQDCTSRNVASF